MSSPAMRWLASGSVAEVLPGCDTCAFVPYCGADPIYHAAVHGDPVGDRETSDHCIRHTFMFSLLFNKLADADAATMTTFLAWALSKSRDEIVAPGHIDR